ncbi:PAS domain S-box protein, partial [Aquabacterium sp.]|uniref:PAS domain S-box protein n=1 Tax=Aquabacterium sp. TaxID=1872578 RepID=UPI0025BE42F3
MTTLRAQVARYRAAFELSGPGQALVGLNGRFLEVNASLCQILGYPAADLLARHFNDITHPDDV